ncbi:MAG: hypothetical protein A4E19_19710 [Nitrospira sp. SG-bin1]|nr:MAG: hypothetical protein A4E19_19710 [Nitrospira sp. SG-bin1]
MASSPTRIGDLEIKQDLDVQRTTWIIQRIGWAAMALIVLAALAGVFSSGPLARTVMTDDQRLFSLEYDRFGRYESESVLRLELTPEATKASHVTLWIDRIYWAKYAIEQILPEPSATRTGSDGFSYTFDIGAQHAPAAIILRLRPEHIGMAEGHIRVNDRGSITFHQLVFP